MKAKTALGPFYAHDGSFINEKGKRIGCVRITDMPEERGKWIAEVYTYGGGTERFSEHEEAIEIAKLFVAAPDLLTAAVDALDFIKTHNHYVATGIVDRLQSIIDKATSKPITPVTNH